MEMFFAYFWVWIPLAGILAGSFSEYLKFKEKTAKLGASNEEMKEVMARMLRERETLVQRIQNLEAIVTHEVWEASQSDGDPAKRAARIDTALLEVEPTDAERAERLAQRLR